MLQRKFLKFFEANIEMKILKTAALRINFPLNNISKKTAIGKFNFFPRV